MIIYLTYNDPPSGIFSSQVIDVVKFFNNDLKSNVKLVSFISIRGFLKNRKKIKQDCSSALVLPMIPGVHRWRLNWIVLYILILFKKPKTIIGRSVLATQLALIVKRKINFLSIVYDGRGAISEEWKEYNVIANPDMLNKIESLEKEVVTKSNFRIAVSKKLIDYWEARYNYSSKNHVVIPCTLSKSFENIVVDEKIIIDARKKLDLNREDVVFIYSGSIAGWQSFDILFNFMSKVLNESKRNKLIFLSEINNNINDFINLFPSQVICKHLNSTEVPDYLLAGDYGLLIRENSVTNQVASPVKFAEYLACGLKVIISDNLGDYSEVIKRNKELGFIYHDCNSYNIVNYEQKQSIINFATKNYAKKAYLTSYQKL